MTLSDLEWLSKTFYDTKHRAVSLRQLCLLSPNVMREIEALGLDENAETPSNQQLCVCRVCDETICADMSAQTCQHDIASKCLPSIILQSESCSASTLHGVAQSLHYMTPGNSPRTTIPPEQQLFVGRKTPGTITPGQFPAAPDLMNSWVQVAWTPLKTTTQPVA